MTSFQFIITFVLTVKILTFLRGMTERIQGRSLDLYDVVNQVNLKVVTTWSISGNLKKVLKKFGKNIPVIIMGCYQEIFSYRRNPSKEIL